MLSEKEKQDLLDMASSAELREDFRRLKKNSEMADPRSMNIDLLMEFLTAVSRLMPETGPRTHIHYKDVRI